MGGRPFVRDLVCLAIAFALPVNLSFAQTSAVRHGDWELVCKGSDEVPQPSEASNLCRLQQAQGIKDAAEVMFLFNIAQQDGKTVAILSTPLNVYLPAGIELKIDRSAPQRAAYETCNVTGCHAGFVLDKAMLSVMRRGSKMLVSISDTKKSKVDITVSLTGVSDGLNALSAGRP